MKANTKIKVGATLVGQEDSGATDGITSDYNLLSNCRPCLVDYQTGNAGILEGYAQGQSHSSMDAYDLKTGRILSTKLIRSK